MASDFLFPSNATLRMIAQEKIPRLTRNRPCFDFMPITNQDTHILMWEQRDNYTGLQQIRGLNGEPSRVKMVSGKRFMVQPGVFGEFLLIDEMQLTTRRQYGSFNGPINVADLVMEAQDKLIGRELDRIEGIIWALVSTGTFSVADGSTVLMTDTFTLQTFSAGTVWSTFATSTPLADLRAVQLKSRGISVNFGAASKMYMNRSTFNNLLSNTNAADLGGRRVTGLMTINGPDALNQVLAADDLPQLIVYDEGYLDDAGVFQLFVPNNKIVLIGARRDGDPIGEYVMTRNANNPDLGPGSYDRVVDEPEDVPRQIEVHRGHNGAPTLWHPQAIVVMTV